MNRQTISEAAKDARAFLVAVEDVLKEMERDNRNYNIVGTRATGELRRRSLDLTRSLADMRRPS